MSTGKRRSSRSRSKSTKSKERKPGGLSSGGPSTPSPPLPANPSDSLTTPSPPPPIPSLPLPDTSSLLRPYPYHDSRTAWKSLNPIPIVSIGPSRKFKVAVVWRSASILQALASKAIDWCFPHSAIARGVPDGPDGVVVVLGKTPVLLLNASAGLGKALKSNKSIQAVFVLEEGEKAASASSLHSPSTITTTTTTTTTSEKKQKTTSTSTTSISSPSASASSSVALQVTRTTLPGRVKYPADENEVSLDACLNNGAVRTSLAYACETTVICGPAEAAVSSLLEVVGRTVLVPRLVDEAERDLNPAWPDYGPVIDSGIARLDSIGSAESLGPDWQNWWAGDQNTIILQGSTAERRRVVDTMLHHPPEKAEVAAMLMCLEDDESTLKPSCMMRDVVMQLLRWLERRGVEVDDFSPPTEHSWLDHDELWSNFSQWAPRAIPTDETAIVLLDNMTCVESPIDFIQASLGIPTRTEEGSLPWLRYVVTVRDDDKNALRTGGLFHAPHFKINPSPNRIPEPLPAPVESLLDWPGPNVDPTHPKAVFISVLWASWRYCLPHALLSDVVESATGLEGSLETLMAWASPALRPHPAAGLGPRLLPHVFAWLEAGTLPGITSEMGHELLARACLERYADYEYCRQFWAAHVAHSKKLDLIAKAVESEVGFQVTVPETEVDEPESLSFASRNDKVLSVSSWMVLHLPPAGEASDDFWETADGVTMTKQVKDSIKSASGNALVKAIGSSSAAAAALHQQQNQSSWRRSGQGNSNTQSPIDVQTIESESKFSIIDPSKKAVLEAKRKAKEEAAKKSPINASDKPGSLQKANAAGAASSLAAAASVDLSGGDGLDEAAMKLEAESKDQFAVQRLNMLVLQCGRAGFVEGLEWLCGPPAKADDVSDAPKGEKEGEKKVADDEADGDEDDAPEIETWPGQLIEDKMKRVGALAMAAECVELGVLCQQGVPHGTDNDPDKVAAYATAAHAVVHGAHDAYRSDGYSLIAALAIGAGVHFRTTGDATDEFDVIKFIEDGFAAAEAISDGSMPLGRGWKNLYMSDTNNIMGMAADVMTRMGSHPHVVTIAALGGTIRAMANDSFSHRGNQPLTAAGRCAMVFLVLKTMVLPGQLVIRADVSEEKIAKKKSDALNKASRYVTKINTKLEKLRAKSEKYRAKTQAKANAEAALSKAGKEEEGASSKSGGIAGWLGLKKKQGGGKPKGPRASARVVDEVGRTALWLAVAFNQPEAVRWLLTKGGAKRCLKWALFNHDLSDPITWTGRWGRVEVAKVFHEVLVPKDWKPKTVFVSAVAHGYASTLGAWMWSQYSELISKDKVAMREAVGRALVRDKWESVQWMIDHAGAPLKSAKYTGYWTHPIILASMSGSIRSMSEILRRDPEAVEYDDNGGDCLQWIGLHGYIPALEWILEKGARVDAQNNDELDTAFSHAVAHGHLDFLKVLYTKGRSRGYRLKLLTGETALHIAVKDGRVAVARWLITACGRTKDVWVTDSDGWTPLNRAVCDGNAEVLAMLLETVGSPVAEALSKKMKIPKQSTTQIGSVTMKTLNGTVTQLPFWFLATANHSRALEVLLKGPYAKKPMPIEASGSVLGRASITIERYPVHYLCGAGPGASGTLRVLARCGKLTREHLGQPDSQAKTPLWHAAHSHGDNWEAVRSLMDSGEGRWGDSIICDGSLYSDRDYFLMEDDPEPVAVPAPPTPDAPDGAAAPPPFNPAAEFETAVWNAVAAVGDGGVPNADAIAAVVQVAVMTGDHAGPMSIFLAGLGEEGMIDAVEDLLAAGPNANGDGDGEGDGDEPVAAAAAAPAAAGDADGDGSGSEGEEVIEEDELTSDSDDDEPAWGAGGFAVGAAGGQTNFVVPWGRSDIGFQNNWGSNNNSGGSNTSYTDATPPGFNPAVTGAAVRYRQAKRLPWMMGAGRALGWEPLPGDIGGVNPPPPNGVFAGNGTLHHAVSFPMQQLSYNFMMVVGGQANAPSAYSGSMGNIITATDAPFDDGELAGLYRVAVQVVQGAANRGVPESDWLWQVTEAFREGVGNLKATEKQQFVANGVPDAEPIQALLKKAIAAVKHERKWRDRRALRERVFQRAFFGDCHLYLGWLMEQSGLTKEHLRGLMTDNGMRLLHAAATAGSVESLKWVVENVYDGEVDVLGVVFKAQSQASIGTALHSAVAARRVDNVQYLLDEAGSKALGIRTSRMGATPIMWAAVLGRVGVMNELVKRASVEQMNITDVGGRSPFFMAVMSNNAGCARMLYAAGANGLSTACRPVLASNQPEKVTPLLAALRLNNLGLVQFLMMETGTDVNSVMKAGGFLLHELALTNNPGIDLKALGQFCDPKSQNADGRTALHVAALVPNTSIVDKLLALDPDIVNIQDKWGATALHIAICSSSASTMVPKLLAAGADPMLRTTRGETPLMLSALRSNASSARALIGSGKLNPREQLEATDLDGDTALHLLYKAGNSSQVLIWIRAGWFPYMDWNAPNNLGITPLMLGFTADVDWTQMTNALFFAGPEALQLTDNFGRGLMGRARMHTNGANRRVLERAIADPDRLWVQNDEVEVVSNLMNNGWTNLQKDLSSNDGAYSFGANSDDEYWGDPNEDLATDTEDDSDEFDSDGWVSGGNDDGGDSDGSVDSMDSVD